MANADCYPRLTLSPLFRNWKVFFTYLDHLNVRALICAFMAILGDFGPGLGVLFLILVPFYLILIVKFLY